MASLMMGPWEEIPGWEQVAEYKAEAVRQFAETAHERPFGPPMYVESCPRQAERIGALSRMMTVCRYSSVVYGPDGCWS